MKMKIELTADELMNVVDAMMDEAIDRGYDPVDDEETADDLLHIVDAALSAMGIEITEDEEDEDEDFDSDFDDDFDDEDEEEDEEDDPIEAMVFLSNGKRTISKDNADMLLGMVAELILADDRIPDNQKWEATQNCFLAFCAEHGLECVDMSEDEDE